MDKFLWGCNLSFDHYKKYDLCVAPAQESSQWIAVGSFSSIETGKGGHIFNV